MNWNRSDEVGQVSAPYRVQKIFENGCTLFELWCENVLIGHRNDFEECQLLAEAHKAEANK